MFEIGYGQILEQKQVMSQNMIQSVQILQMDVQSLETYLWQQAMENPVLDLEQMEKGRAGAKSEMPEDDREKLQQKLEWLNRCDEQNRVYYSQEYEETMEAQPWNRAVEENSLSAYLMSQLLLEVTTGKEQEDLEFLVDCLDSRGYLTEELTAIARSCGISMEQAQRLLELVQSAEPAGVGARNLEECLTLQIRRLRESGRLDQDRAARLLRLCGCLPILEKKHFAQAARLLGNSQKQVEEDYRYLQTLNPIPGNSFSARETLQAVKPDVTVVKFRDYLEILINDDQVPGLAFNSYYLRMMKEDESAEVRDYILEKYRQALWVQKCIQERGKTLERVTRELVELQKPFFESREGTRVPMSLKDVADRLQMHESTVSRAVKNKFLQCSRGVYPMNWFFVKRVGQEEEGETSETIKEKIRELIEAENKVKPLSDQKLAEKLADMGVSVSRRTVAKYRGQLLIPDASGRKKRD